MLARSRGAARIVLVELNRARLDASAAVVEPDAFCAVPVARLITHRLPLERVLDGLELVARGEAINVTIEP
jgi:L-iditol 2-dehydrogenase